MNGAVAREICASPQEIGDRLAQRIATEVLAATLAGRRYVLGCPAGRTPLPVYRGLGVLAAAGEIGDSAVDIVMMDEFVLAYGTGWRRVSEDAHFSCAGFAHRHILTALPKAKLHVPDPAEPAGYERLIAELGGIDLFLLASGGSDGHVAFNPIGSAIDSLTRIVALAEETRRDNLGTFPQFASVEDVPTHGVTVGLGTIVRQSKSVVMLLHGVGKAESFRRLHTLGRFDPSWPASVTFACANATIMADNAAAGVIV